LLGSLLHREEQFFEIGCPDGSLLLCLKHQLSEKMNQAESMLTVIQEVRCPGIMDADAFEDRQDANRVQRVLSSALIHMIMGEGRRCQRQSRFGSSWFLVNHCKMLLYLICSCTNLLQEVAQNADYATVSLTRRTGNDLDQRDIGATARACDLAPFQFALPTLFVFVNDIGGQFRIRIGARDSFAYVTDNQIWGPSDPEKGKHLAFAHKKESHL